MAGEPDVTETTEAAGAAGELRAAGVWPRVVPWLDVIVVLCLAVLPDIAHSALPAVYPEAGGSQPMGLMGSVLVVRSVQVAAPVLYLMWRSGLGWAHFGIVRVRWVRDPGLGVLLVMLTYGAYLAMWMLVGPAFVEAGWDESSATATVPRPGGRGDWVWVLVIAVFNGSAEELVVRGYLVPRLERLLGSAGPAVLITAGLFAAYHTYQGVFAALGVLVTGLIYGAAFVRTRRLWPVVFAHMLADVVPFMV